MKLTDGETTILGGVIRNGQLTHADRRHTLELEEYDSRRAVIVILPAAHDQRVTEATLEEAARKLSLATGSELVVGTIESTDPPAAELEA